MTTHTPDDGAPLSIAAAMDLAVDLARRGPLVDPNPRVGAVLLDTAGRLLGSGYHRGSGTPHGCRGGCGVTCRHAGDHLCRG